MVNDKNETKRNGFVWCVSLITLFFITIIVVCGFRKWKDKTRVEISPTTNEYFVIQNHKDEPEWVGKEVAKRLSDLTSKVDALVYYMYQNRLPTPEIADRLQQRWTTLRQNPNGIRETALGETSAAYTVNKHEQIRICIRNPKTPTEFEDHNSSMFVLLHELAHVMSKGYGHDQEFKDNFSAITKIAVQLGLYNYVNYSVNPMNYCGTDVTNTSY